MVRATDNGMSLNNLNLRFFDEDSKTLSLYFGLADGIASLLGPHCEVVVHSFANFNESVVKIVNGDLSSRKVGSPLTNYGLRLLRDYLETRKVEPKAYFTRNARGGLVKSSSILLFGTHGNPIGMLCINYDLSVPFPEFVDSLMGGLCSGRIPKENEDFSIKSDDVINKALEDAYSSVKSDSAIKCRNKNKTIVERLFNDGIFALKGSVKIVADRLGITEYAVYKYTREFQKKADSNNHEGMTAKTIRSQLLINKDCLINGNCLEVGEVGNKKVGAETGA